MPLALDDAALARVMIAATAVALGARLRADARDRDDGIREVLAAEMTL